MKLRFENDISEIIFMFSLSFILELCINYFCNREYFINI